MQQLFAMVFLPFIKNIRLLMYWLCYILDDKLIII